MQDVTADGGVWAAQYHSLGGPCRPGTFISATLIPSMSLDRPAQH